MLPSLQSNQIPRYKLGQQGSVFKFHHTSLDGPSYQYHRWNIHGAMQSLLVYRRENGGICGINFATAGACQLMRYEPSLLL